MHSRVIHMRQLREEVVPFLPLKFFYFCCCFDLTLPFLFFPFFDDHPSILLTGPNGSEDC